MSVWTMGQTEKKAACPQKLFSNAHTHSLNPEEETGEKDLDSGMERTNSYGVHGIGD